MKHARVPQYPDNCIFCKIADRRESADIIYEDGLCMAFLDKFPKTVGHLQLIPKKHYRYIYDCPQMGQIFDTAAKLIHDIIPLLKANFVTIGTFGREIHHAHVWIVPQYDKIVRAVEGMGQTIAPGDRHKLAEYLSSNIKGGVRF